MLKISVPIDLANPSVTGGITLSAFPELCGQQINSLTSYIVRNETEEQLVFFFCFFCFFTAKPNKLTRDKHVSKK